MSRSLIRQLEQIRRSEIYNDSVLNINSSSVSEPTVSGSLEDDLNNVRTLMKDLKGSTNWFDSLGTYFDPTNTTSGNAATKNLNISNIGGNTLDSKTIILAVSDDNTGIGFTVSGTSDGVLLPLTTTYAGFVDRRGLPIFASATGSYFDEGGSDNVCRIDILDMATDTFMQTNSGEIVYAKFHDGIDFGGVGSGTDVYAKFYAGGVALSDLSTISGTSPTALKFVYPYRKILSEVSEYEWMRTDFISSWEGDVELIDDIQDLWSYTGSSDNLTDPVWTNTGNYYPLDGNPNNLTTGVNDINDAIGSRDYTGNGGLGNYISDGQSITASLDALDIQVSANTIAIAAFAGNKYVEDVTTTIFANVTHSLPYSITYTPSSTAGQEGINMDVYVNGQLLSADTGSNGINADRDYGETSTTSITFRFNIKPNSNIVYVVRQ
jgi:hypothetical protein